MQVGRGVGGGKNFSRLSTTHENLVCENDDVHVCIDVKFKLRHVGTALLF